MAPQEVEGDGLALVEVERPDDAQLHLPDLGLRVRVVRDVDEVGDGGSVDLLDLRDEEHRGHSDQLQLGAGDAAALQSQESDKICKLFSRIPETWKIALVTCQLC